MDDSVRTMITLPEGFVATKYSGYFWHIPTQKLYSIKIAGELREMTIRPPVKLTINGMYVDYPESYQISHRGTRRYLTLTSLKKLVYKDSVIPYKKK